MTGWFWMQLITCGYDARYRMLSTAMHVGESAYNCKNLKLLGCIHKFFNSSDISVGQPSKLVWKLQISRKKRAGSNDPQKPISSWIPSRDQNKWIFLSMLLNVTAMLVVRDKTNPIQKSFASWNCTESLSPKREAIMEMRWWGGAWHAFKALFNMVMTTIWSLAKILHFETLKIELF